MIQVLDSKEMSVTQGCVWVVFWFSFLFFKLTLHLQGVPTVHHLFSFVVSQMCKGAWQNSSI